MHIDVCLYASVYYIKQNVSIYILYIFFYILIFLWKNPYGILPLCQAEFVEHNGNPDENLRKGNHKLAQSLRNHEEFLKCEKSFFKVLSASTVSQGVMLLAQTQMESLVPGSWVWPGSNPDCCGPQGSEPPNRTLSFSLYICLPNK